MSRKELKCPTLTGERRYLAQYLGITLILIFVSFRPFFHALSLGSVAAFSYLLLIEIQCSTSSLSLYFTLLSMYFNSFHFVLQLLILCFVVYSAMPVPGGVSTRARMGSVERPRTCGCFISPTSPTSQTLSRRSSKVSQEVITRH